MVVRQVARRALRQSASLSAPRRARPAPAPAVGGGRRGGARRRRPRGTRADAPEGSTRPRPEDRPRGGRRRRRRVADRPRQSRRGRRDARARRGAAQTRHRPRRASAASSRVVLRARWPTPERRPPPHRAASVRGASRHPRRWHRAIRLRRARDLLGHFFSVSATETDTRRAPTCSPKQTNSEAFLATLDRGVSAAARGRREKSRPGAISRDREPRTRRQRLPFFRATTSRDGGISGGVAAPRAHHAARDPTRAPPPRRRAPRVTQGRRDGPFRRARATVRLEPDPGPIRARRSAQISNARPRTWRDRHRAPMPRGGPTLTARPSPHPDPRALGPTGTSRSTSRATPCP